MVNPYLPQESIIEEVIPETPTIKTFVLRPENGLKFSTGQFIELTVPGVGEAPFTPSSSPFQTEKVEITVMDVGHVTHRLHQMRQGDRVGIRGPYGRGYPLEEFYNKEVLVLGGGVGFAPLRSLLFTLLHDLSKYKRVVLCYGAKTPADIVYKGLIPQWREKIEVLCSVDRADETWKEHEGVVTTLLDKFEIDIKNSVAVVCGPPVMMKFATFKLLDLGYRPEDIYLSMERKMYCGIGQCRHCMIGGLFVCKDGPVFTYSQVKELPDIWA